MLYPSPVGGPRSDALAGARAGLAAFLVAASGWSGAKPIGPALRRFSLLFVIIMDLQFLLGLDSFSRGESSDASGLSKHGGGDEVQESRFFTVEHTTYMLIAVALAHIGGILGAQDRRSAAPPLPTFFPCC